jgi:hypothetical protein
MVCAFGVEKSGHTIINVLSKFPYMSWRSHGTQWMPIMMVRCLKLRLRKLKKVLWQFMIQTSQYLLNARHLDLLQMWGRPRYWYS